MGYALGYTSYDYGAIIAEDRSLTREKYSEAKLEANFLRSSPAYLTANPGIGFNGSFGSPASITVTPLRSNTTSFYVIRHAAYNSNASTNYTLKVPTTRGNLTIPQLSPFLQLNGRDSKIHVTDYDIGKASLLYSTAEIFTWQSYGSKTVLIVYGGLNETHELAIESDRNMTVLECGPQPPVYSQSHVQNSGKTNGGHAGVGTRSIDYTLVVNWAVSPVRTVLRVGDNLFVYLLDRNEAYNYWVLDLPSKNASGPFARLPRTSVIVKAGYLIRSAGIEGSVLALTGDANATTSLEVVGAPDDTSAVSFNGQVLETRRDDSGVLVGQLDFVSPKITLPDLSALCWKYRNSLPEIQPGYDDTFWTSAENTETQNPRSLTTPVSLYGSDYGYNVGTLLFRGHFVATGSESTLSLETQGGTAFGHSIWLNNTFIGSWAGISIDDNYNQTLQLPHCIKGQPYVFTIVIDTTGLEEENWVGNGTMKHPRGIIKYDLADHKSDNIKWKITGNLGGEDYQDRTRGPLNEGGMFAERQGYHLPAPPADDWPCRKPTNGMSTAGIGFYTTSFDLDMPTGYDIPLSFVFKNSTANQTSSSARGSLASPYRVQLFVNGYQFGKYGTSSTPICTSSSIPSSSLIHELLSSQ